MATGVERSLEAFFREHPSGPFFVYTFATSGWGLTKLHELAPERPVTLLLRDANEAIRGKMRGHIWRAGRAFLARDDVAIKRLTSAWSTDETRELVVLCDPDSSGSASFRALVNLSVAGMTENPVADPAIQVETPADGELVRLWNRHCDATSDQKRVAVSTLDVLLREAGGNPERERALRDDHQAQRSDPFAVRDEPPPPPPSPIEPQPPRGDAPRPDVEPERPSTSASTETGTEASRLCEPEPEPPSPPRPPPPPPPPRGPRDHDGNRPRRWIWMTVLVLVAIFALLLVLAQFIDTSDESSPQPTITPETTPTTTTTTETSCHPAYEGYCVPIMREGEIFRCSQVPDNRRPFKVPDPTNDPYDLDRDDDGRACEPPPQPATTEANCHDAYQGYCVPLLAEGEVFRCSQVPDNRRPFKVPDPTNDPYDLDRDDDGRACEPPPQSATSSTTPPAAASTTAP